MDFDSFFKARVDALHAEGRYRVFADLERRCGRFPRAFDHRIGAEVTVWCSNDYLGMGQHPAVLAAMAEELRGSGAGAGGTRNISGTSHAHVLLERELADLHGCAAALVFTSGFVANEAALSTLASSMPGMVVLSDAMNHASMIAGIRNSRAERLIFRHNDPDDLARLLAGPAMLVDFLLGHAPGFIFTSALPPLLAAGALAAVRHLKGSQSERDAHRERVAAVKRRLAEAGIPVMANDSHIVPVMIGDAALCRTASDRLLRDHQIY